MSTHKFINNVELSTFNDEYFQTQLISNPMLAILDKYV